MDYHEELRRKEFVRVSNQKHVTTRMIDSVGHWFAHNFVSAALRKAWYSFTLWFQLQIVPWLEFGLMGFLILFMISPIILLVLWLAGVLK